MRLPPYQATSSLVFTPSICTSEADSYWFDLDLRRAAAGQTHGFSQKPNITRRKSRAERRAGSPLVSEDGAADVEPDALAGASLHHLAASAAGDEGWGAEELRRRRLPGKEGRETLAVGAGGGLCIPRSREWTVRIGWCAVRQAGA
jgi:hypothetical protein